MRVCKRTKVRGIIHSSSAFAGAVGAGMAQIIGSDGPIIAGIQATMIMGIAEIHGIPMTRAAAVELVVPFAATHGGRAISQVCLGWIPGWGNAINASTAAALTEAVGWAVHARFASMTGTERAAAA